MKNRDNQQRLWYCEPGEVLVLTRGDDRVTFFGKDEHCRYSPRRTYQYGGGDRKPLKRGSANCNISIRRPSREEREIAILLSKGYKMTKESSGAGGGGGAGDKAAEVGAMLQNLRYEPIQHARPTDASRSIAAMRQLIGSLSDRDTERPRIDIGGLLVALEGADDPTRYLEVPTPTHPKLRVLMTIDQSGSCLGDADIWEKWANDLVRRGNKDGVNVIVSYNANGSMENLYEVVSVEAQSWFYRQFDLIIYCGDMDWLTMSELGSLPPTTQLVVLSKVGYRQRSAFLDARYSTRSRLVFNAVDPMWDDSCAYCIEYACRHL